jgi:hypothetical protein
MISHEHTENISRNIEHAQFGTCQYTDHDAFNIEENISAL